MPFTPEIAQCKLSDLTFKVQYPHFACFTSLSSIVGHLLSVTVTYAVGSNFGETNRPYLIDIPVAKWGIDTKLFSDFMRQVGFLNSLTVNVTDTFKFPS